MCLLNSCYNFMWLHLGILLLISLQKGYGQDFGYDGSIGPSHWGEKYSQCVGKYQSPIDITDGNINLVKLDPILYENFDEVPTEASLTNNGHTVMYKMKHDRMPQLSGGPLQGIYKFEQLHFHWGEHDDEGSETKINNNSFPLELHMVFYKEEYNNMSEATQHHDGLTVLAFLYKITEGNNTNYDNILDMLHHVKYPNETINIGKPSAMNDYLMPDRRRYFTYDGSLTTPPCSEAVIWIEFKKPIGLSHEQLEVFRTLNNEDGRMTHNFRPTQPLYDRIIYYNSEDEYYDVDNSVDDSLMNVESVQQRSSSNRNYYSMSLYVILMLTISSFIF